MNFCFAGLLAALLLCCGAALAAAPPAATAAAGAPPTRLQHCQREMRDESGEARKRALRECLMRRSEGEAGVVADCRRQLRIGGGQVSAAQQRQLRDCETRALAVPSQQLPRRPVPRAAPAASMPTAAPPGMPPRTVAPGHMPAPPSAPAREGA